VLGYRIANMWNALPEGVVSADSVNCFKGRFDRSKKVEVNVFVKKLKFLAHFTLS